MLKFVERNPGLRYRLILLGLSLPLMLVAGVFIWLDYDSRHDAIITEVRLQSDAVNGQLETFVQTVREASAILGLRWVNEFDFNPSDPTVAANLNMYLENIVAVRPKYSRASITDATGLVTASSAPFSDGEIIGPGQFYQRAFEANRFMASDVVIPGGEGSPFVVFAQPLRWEQGHRGFLVLQSDLATLSAVMDMSEGFPATAKSGVFDSQGVIVAGTGYQAPHPGLAAGRNISASAVWAKASARPTGEWFGPGLDKVDRMIFFGYPNLTSWVTTVAYAQSELLGPLWQRLWIFIGVLAATALAIFWVGEVLVRRERRAVTETERERVTLDAVMNGAKSGILVIDVDGSVIYANDRIAQMFSLGPTGLAGRPAGEIRDLMASRGDDPEQMADQLARAMAAGAGIVVDNLSLKESAGLDLEMTAYPLQKADGQTLGLTMAFHDVTQAMAVQRMKSQFLATASHQLRTPMSSILAFSELSLSKDVDAGQRREWMEVIQSQSTRMANVIDTMLNVSQIESGKLDLNLKALDAQEACRGALDGFDAKPESHRFEIQIPGQLKWIWADESRFAQILENLVDNAVKYSPDGGVVTVSADSLQDGMVRFGVSDTGVGISSEGQKLLFLPFSRVLDSRTSDVPGTGLGLYISRTLTELHGGEMWIESSRSGGTTVYFTMRRAAQPVGQAANGHNGHNGHNGRNGHNGHNGVSGLANR